MWEGGVRFSCVCVCWEEVVGGGEGGRGTVGWERPLFSERRGEGGKDGTDWVCTCVELVGMG